MKEESRNIRLGTFVAIATILLVVALYIVGNKQNLFGSTFHISANFRNVNGLMKGNNVRFAGIDVGTVESIEIINDTSINVTMVIEKRVQKHIKKNAIASLGTDGLMGNKLVNINTISDHSTMVSEGDVLASQNPLEMDDMIRTLNVTNENVKVISGNLRSITDKFNDKNSLWGLLMDSTSAEKVNSTLVNLKLMGNHGVMITGNLKHITDDVKNGKGSIGALITDTALSYRINQTIVKLEKVSDTAAYISGDLSSVVKQLKNGKGTLGILLNDTALISDLNKSMINIKTSTGKFDENMEALKYSWPFKKYFKKQKKNKL